MDFFEKIGKRLSDAGQNVAQQTKGFADVAKLNAGISKTEKKISQLLLVIGQAYYQKHKNDADAEEIELIKQINALYAEIAESQEKIKQIKGLVKCPNCGTDLPSGASFCTVCSTQMNTTEENNSNTPSDERVCPSCKSPVEPGHLFCMYCGAKME